MGCQGIMPYHSIRKSRGLTFMISSWKFADQMRGSRGAIDSFKEDFTAFPGCIGQWDNGLATMPRIHQIRPSAVAKCIQSTRWDPGMIAVWQSLRAGSLKGAIIAHT